MIKKPFNQIFNGDLKILEKLKINLNLRPQNLNFETYYKLTEEYEKFNWLIFQYDFSQNLNHNL